MSSAPPTPAPVPKTRPLVPVYLLASGVALAWRAAALPWDGAGVFVQLVVTGFGVMTFVSAKPPTRDRFQRAVYYTLFTASCGLWSFQSYYPVLTTVPFIICCFVFALVWGGDKRTSVKLVDTLSVSLPLAGLFALGVYNALPVYRLRSIDAGRVSAVELVPSSQGEGAVISFTSRTEVAEFVYALRAATTPAPVYRRGPAGWHATVFFDSGESFHFDLDDGAGSNRDACVIRLGSNNYQSSRLCRLLRLRISNPARN